MTINLDELRAAASKVLAEEAHEFGWHVGTEATTYGTLSHVYTPDRMTDLEAHRIIATNMSDTDAQYLANLHPARLLALLSRLEQAEQAVDDLRGKYDEAETARIDGDAQLDRVRELHSYGKLIYPNGDEEHYCTYDENAWPCETIRALDGDGRRLADDALTARTTKNGDNK